jgi:TetR/AcrR family transcriptional regulator, regulator of autoinduction and epiphytic fitness
MQKVGAELDFIDGQQALAYSPAAVKGGAATSARRPTPAAGEGQADRRLARGSATRAVLVGATVELLIEGDPRPTSLAVARRAGVSRRLVFYYYPRLDMLVLRAVESQLARQRSLITPIPPKGPADVRIDGVCRQRRDLFELLGPIYGAAGHLVPAHRSRAPSRPIHLADLRYQLAVTFAPEIERCGRDGPAVLLWLDAITSWEHWQILRTRDGLTPRAAQLSTAALVRRVLTGSLSDPRRKIRPERSASR